MSYAQAMRFNRKHPKGTRPFGKGPMLMYAAETKHTPGPWTCEFTACDKDGIKQVIAAAPALLEVCRAMATEIDRFCAENNIGGGFGVTHKAWVVIAAAEGK